MTRTTTRGPAVLGAVALVAIALAACGGGSTTTSTTTSKARATNAAATQSPTSTNGATGSAQARRPALTACLKKYGVTLPSFGGRLGAAGGTGASGRRGPIGPTGASGPPGGFPGAGGGFASNPKLAQALQKCGGVGGLGRFGASGRTGTFNFSNRIRTELTSFVACMKKHGETLPTPNLNGTGSVFGNVNQTTPTFKAAYAQCKGILTYLNQPRRPAGATGSTTS